LWLLGGGGGAGEGGVVAGVVRLKTVTGDVCLLLLAVVECVFSACWELTKTSVM
jgi:hypothetical protein